MLMETQFATEVKVPGPSAALSSRLTLPKPIGRRFLSGQYSNALRAVAFEETPRFYGGEA
jgi:hypothetical protein